LLNCHIGLEKQGAKLKKEKRNRNEKSYYDLLETFVILKMILAEIGVH
jgi:hypothetical protein